MSVLWYVLGERLRWENHISALEEEKTTVWLDILLCSAFIVYLGAQTESRRNQYSQSWGRLLQKYDYNSVSFDFAKTLGTEREHSFWCNWGLPCDELCLQNAAILSSSKTKVCYRKRFYVFNSYVWPKLSFIFFIGIACGRSRWPCN